MAILRRAAIAPGAFAGLTGRGSRVGRGSRMGCEVGDLVVLFSHVRLYQDGTGSLIHAGEKVTAACAHAPTRSVSCANAQAASKGLCGRPATERWVVSQGGVVRGQVLHGGPGLFVPFRRQNHWITFKVPRLNPQRQGRALA